MAKKKSSSNPPVQHPLAPSVLTEMGCLKTPPPTGEFSPAKDWAASFRIWTCYGYVGRSNYDVGLLTIGRQLNGEAQRLAILHTLKNSEGKLHTIRAKVRCKLDALAGPTSWSLESEFAGEHMEGRPPMAAKEIGRIRGGAWQVSVGDRTTERKISGPVAADWCLFEAVTRLDFRDGPPLTFDLLEGLSLLKADHRLSYRGKLPVTWGPAKAQLHCFAQVGRGVYPYEYWLDDAHRLLLVTTGPRIYVRDAEAKKAFEAGGTKR